MADNKLEPVPPELLAIMEKLAEQLPELPDHEEASRRFEWLLDALILRGQLPDSFRRLAKKIQADRGTKVRLATFSDKYTVESADIDCAARIPLCGARCCSMVVALSAQDLRERKLPFVYQRNPVRCSTSAAFSSSSVLVFRVAAHATSSMFKKAMGATKDTPTSVLSTGVTKYSFAN